jgi:hypothetical protein
VQKLERSGDTLPGWHHLSGIRRWAFCRAVKERFHRPVIAFAPPATAR